MTAGKVSEAIRMLKQARDLVRDAQGKVMMMRINGGTAKRLESIIDRLNEEAARLGN